MFPITLIDIYTEAICLSVGFINLRLSTYTITMFLQVSNIKSSSVESLSINAKTNQALVRYIGNDQPYLYSNVPFAAISEVVLTEIDSIGRWVNTNLKQNDAVTCYSV